MNYVFISPHFQPFYIPFATALCEQGVNVLGAADAPREHLPGALSAALGEYYRVQNMEDYDCYITQEVVPFIRQTCNHEPILALTTGASMGGYHAANFFFRHPHLFNLGRLLQAQA
jgi:hypothetical protein